MPKGVHKGKRGRRRSALPPELVEQLGPPPIDKPLALARWYQSAISILTWLVAQGRPYNKLLETVRASAGAAGRVLPHDIIFEAARILDESERGMKNTNAGPTPTTRSGDSIGSGQARSVRRDPS